MSNKFNQVISSIKSCCQSDKEKNMKKSGGCGAIYGMGFLGALVYFMQHATGFWAVILGIFKAIFWPGMILYKVLEMLKF